MVAVMLGLAGAVVVAHSAMDDGHMNDMSQTMVMCLAVAETAVIAVGAALALGASMQRPLRWLAPLPALNFWYVASSLNIRSRASPPQLQVFHL